MEEGEEASVFRELDEVVARKRRLEVELKRLVYKLAAAGVKKTVLAARVGTHRNTISAWCKEVAQWKRSDDPR